MQEIYFGLLTQREDNGPHAPPIALFSIWLPK
jgi:hypothetical protein